MSPQCSLRKIQIFRIFYSNFTWISTKKKREWTKKSMATSELHQNTIMQSPLHFFNWNRFNSISKFQNTLIANRLEYIRSFVFFPVNRLSQNLMKCTKVQKQAKVRIKHIFVVLDTRQHCSHLLHSKISFVIRFFLSGCLTRLKLIWMEHTWKFKIHNNLSKFTGEMSKFTFSSEFIHKKNVEYQNNSRVHSLLLVNGNWWLVGLRWRTKSMWTTTTEIIRIKLLVVWRRDNVYLVVACGVKQKE